MRVNQAQQAELLQSGLAGAARPERQPRASFAKELAHSEKGEHHGARKTAGDADGMRRGEKIPKGPKGETTRAVPDHPAYVEIMSGPRNGMFINMTNNERRGEAFVLVKRDDHDLHIYGTGKDRRVIISWHKDQPAHQDDAKTPRTGAPAQDATGGATAPTA